MRYQVLFIVMLAGMMLIIPLLALQSSDMQISPTSVFPSMSSSKNLPEETTSTVSLPNDTQVDTSTENIDDVEASKPAQKGPAKSDDTTNVIMGDGEDFRILDRSTGKIMNVSPRDFVRGALAAEMPPNFHAEALKAQAVAAHTYALYVKNHNSGSENTKLKGADFSADPQNWKSYTTQEIFRERYGDLADAYWKNICEAADSVFSYAMTYDNQPILAAYHSMSSGFTEDAQNVWTRGMPYLIPVESRGDTLAPDFVTEQELSYEEVKSALISAYADIDLGEDPTTWIVEEERSDSDYVTKLNVGGVEISGQELRTLLGLRSTDFTVNCADNKFIFTVKGYGHGVGLSQYGADYMARQGESFEKILEHYYPNTSLAAIATASA